MKRSISRFIALIAALVLAQAGFARPRIGEKAPDFTATDSNGKTQRLSDYAGKIVVLEWHNRGCPYTQKHYKSGNMQSLQKKWTEQGVVWFTVISSAPGKQGYVTAAEENAFVNEIHASPTAVLLDPTGQLGHLYDAKTTPQIVVINKDRLVVYDGAIDDRPTTDVSDIAGARNYADLALAEVTAGKPVSVAVTRPYGCSVKYPN